MSAVTDLPRRKSSASVKHLLKRVALPLVVFVPLGYFFHRITQFYAVCGIYDVARNRNIDGGVLQRYFLSNGIATWLLSPFNILMWNAQPRLIDFPQAVDPRMNRNAYALLYRDIDNVCRHFARYGIDANATRIAGEMWSEFVKGML